LSHEGEIYAARPPIPVQKALLAALALVGRALGYKDHYPKYSGSEAPGAEGAGPPSTTSVMMRGVALVGSLLVTSLFLVRWVRPQGKG